MSLLDEDYNGNEDSLLGNITMERYERFRDELWNNGDYRTYFLAIIPVETGATPGEIVNIRINAFKEHRSIEGKSFLSVFVQEGAKRIISEVRRKGKKGKKIYQTTARAREIVFNTRLSKEISTFIRLRRDTDKLLNKLGVSTSPFFIDREKPSRKNVMFTPLSRAGISKRLSQSQVPIMYNLHQRRNGKEGGRHLFYKYMSYRLIDLGKYDDRQVRKMMGHAPKDVHEAYDPQVNIDLAFKMVEACFVGVTVR